MKSLKSKRKWILPEKKIEGDVIEYLLKERDIEDRGKFLKPSLEDIPSP